MIMEGRKAHPGIRSQFRYTNAGPEIFPQIGNRFGDATCRAVQQEQLSQHAAMTCPQKPEVYFSGDEWGERFGFNRILGQLKQSCNRVNQGRIGRGRVQSLLSIQSSCISLNFIVQAAT